MEKCCANLVSHFNRNDRMSFRFILCFHLKEQLDLGNNEAELAAVTIGKSDNAVPMIWYTLDKRQVTLLISESMLISS